MVFRISQIKRVLLGGDGDLDNASGRESITYFPLVEARVEIALGISRKSASPPLWMDQLGC